MPPEPPPKATSTTNQPSWMAPVMPVVPDHELLRRIGGGSYGDVWLARTTVGTWRAVKVVFRDRFTDARPYEREFNGIQKFEPLSRGNEAFIDILQIGRNDTEGYFYYVMELADDATEPPVESSELRVEGEAKSPDKLSTLNFQPSTYIPKTLSKVLLQRGRLPLSECLELGLTLNLGLAHLHRAGLIHRDIKPSNLIFVGGVPKLADIGLVIETSEARSYVGTEGFIPPEGPNSPQADLFSLGKVLYEAGMGKDRKDFPEPFTQIIDSPDSAQLLEFNAILLKACAANVKERYQSAEEMNVDLALLQSGGSVRRQRKLAGQLRFIQRAGAVVTVIAAVAAGLYFWQARQTKIVSDLADQNRQIATDKTQLAEENRRLAEQNRDQLVRLRVGHGIQALDGGDPYGALLWFAEALPLVEGDPLCSAKHRVRIKATLGEQPRLLHVFDFTKRVYGFNVSLDQHWIAAGSANGLVAVWDVMSGEARGQPLQCSHPVVRSVFSADASVVLLLTKDNQLRLWEPDSGTVRSNALTNIVRIEVNRDRRRLMTVENDESVRLRDMNTLEPLGPTIREAKNLVWAKFSFDGTRIATSTADGLVRVWDPVTGLLVASPLVHSNKVHWMNFSPDNQRLVTAMHRESAGDGVQFWRLSDSTRIGEPILTEWGDGGIATMKFSRDGTKLGAIGQTPTEVKIWNAATRQLVFTPLPHPGHVFDFNFSADGTRLVTSCKDGNTRVWSAETGELLAPPLHHAGMVFMAEFGEDGERVFSASDDGTVKVWRLKTYLSPGVVVRDEAAPLTAAFTPDGRRIATAGNGWTTRMWDARDGQPLGPPMPDPNRQVIGSIRFSPDGRKLVTCIGRRGGGNSWNLAQIWDVTSGTPVGAPLHHDRAVRFAAFSPDGRFVITASEDQTVRVWNAADGSPAGSPVVLQKCIFDADLSPDGNRLATAGENGAVHVLDLITRKPAFPPLDQSGDTTAVRFSPDGRRLASVGTDQMGYVWDAQTGKLITPPFKHANEVNLVNWRPDGRAVVTAGVLPDAEVWDASTGKLLFAPLAHRAGTVRQACFSPDGRFIATCGDDHCARVWDAQTGEPITPQLRHGRGVSDVAFSPDSRRIVTASTDGTARIYELTPTTLPASVLSAYSRYQSGHILDESGAYRPIPAAEMRALGRELRAQHPELFE